MPVQTGLGTGEYDPSFFLLKSDILILSICMQTMLSESIAAIWLTGWTGAGNLRRTESKGRAIPLVTGAFRMYLSVSRKYKFSPQIFSDGNSLTNNYVSSLLIIKAISYGQRFVNFEQSRPRSEDLPLIHNDSPKPGPEAVTHAWTCDVWLLSVSKWSDPLVSTMCVTLLLPPLWSKQYIIVLVMFGLLYHSTSPTRSSYPKYILQESKSKQINEFKSLTNRIMKIEIQQIQIKSLISF